MKHLFNEISDYPRRTHQELEFDLLFMFNVECLHKKSMNDT